MSTDLLAAFEIHLQNTLNHLYNPLFRADEQVYAVLGLQAGQGMDAVRQAIKQEIEAMRPAQDVPASTYAHRYYELLARRYLASLSQEETAYQMQMTPRNLRRYQQQAVHVLAQSIWERQPEGARPSTDRGSEPPAIVKELEVLLDHSAKTPAVISESLERVQGIARVMLHGLQPSIEMPPGQAALMAEVHPTVLDQILLSTVEQLAQHLPGAGMVLRAAQRDGQVEIQVEASRPVDGDRPVGSSHAEPAAAEFSLKTPVPEILSLTQAGLVIRQDAPGVVVRYSFHGISLVPVLLVDDNPDFAYLFQRYTRHTRYRVHSISKGADLRDALEEVQPKIIILDVLLPDVDGWQLLIDLQKSLDGTCVPVVVCSALGQADMALSLGARAFLPKPVDREHFLRVLDGLAV